MVKRVLAAVLILLTLVSAGCFPARESGHETVVTAPTDPMTQEPTAAPAEPASEAPSAEPSASPEPSPETAAPTEKPTELPAKTPEPTFTAEPSVNITFTPKPTKTPKPTEKPTDTPNPTKTPKPTEKPAETPGPSQSHTGSAPDPGVIDPNDPVLMFAGDLMCLSGQQYAAMSSAGSSSHFDFSPSFEYVAPILSRADLAFANLESTLSPNFPYAYQQTMTDGMPNCNGPAEYLAAVKAAGFDALALANNHCCDAGLQGILDTISAADEYGFIHTGVFASPEEPRFVIVNIRGIKTALLSYAEFYNGKEGCVTSVGRPYMINTYSESTVRRDIEQARSAGAEFVIVYEHWGREHTHVPTDIQRRHAVKLANAGADLICGSHSHTVQPSVWVEADDGRRVLCLYSMGNFVSSMSQDASKDTFITELHIHKDGDGNVTIANEIYHPCRVLRTYGGKAFVVMPTSQEGVSASVRKELDAAEARITGVLFGER